MIFVPIGYSLSKKERKSFYQYLKCVKVSKRYHKYTLYDFHILNQQLLFMTICEILSKNVKYIVTQLCSFFNLIYNKIVNPWKLDKLE